MVIEGHQTLGGEHAIQCTDDVLYICTLEAYFNQCHPNKFSKNIFFKKKRFHLEQTILSLWIFICPKILFSGVIPSLLYSQYQQFGTRAFPFHRTMQISCGHYSVVISYQLSSSPIKNLPQNHPHLFLSLERARNLQESLLSLQKLKNQIILSQVNKKTFQTSTFIYSFHSADAEKSKME